MWYLAVDMQLFAISPIIIYLLWKTPKLGLAIIISGLILGMLITGVVTGYFEYPDRSLRYTIILSLTFRHISLNYCLFLSYEEEYELLKITYLMPFCRSNPWIVGIILGYEIANNQERKLSKVTKKNIYIIFFADLIIRIGLYFKMAVIVGWIISTLGFLYVLYGITRIFGPDRINDIVFVSSFAASCRFIWGLSVAWIIFASFHGYAGKSCKIIVFHVAKRNKKKSF